MSDQVPEVNNPSPDPSCPPTPDLQASTRAVRAGLSSDPAFGAVVAPLHLSVSYEFAEPDRPGLYDYGRSANPTRDLFGKAVADLEGGATGCVTASGMGAITTTVLALLPANGTVLAPADCYGGTWRLFEALHRTGRIGRIDYVDFSDPAAATAAIATGPDLVWVETPSNPLLRVADLPLLSHATHRAGAIVVADNTFASPILQRPLQLGADVVVHSATKYLNGHSDVIAGVVVSADPDRGAELGWWANTLGVPAGAFDSYLALRGLRTLHLRMAAAQANAAAVAELLDGHPAVRAVHYPGLSQHPQHELARRQMDGFGAIVTFELADADAARSFTEGLHCFCLAESLGGVESLVSLPATMTHAAMSAQAQRAAGITPGLLRLSLGVEHTADLVADVAAGLERALGGR
jgi:O-succinylhomoserine (thiol)-lyase